MAALPGGTGDVAAMFVQGTCVVTQPQCVWPHGSVHDDARKQQEDSQGSDDLSCVG